MNKLFSIVFILLSLGAFGQGFSLADTTITFKSTSGKVMTSDEVIAFAQQGSFSTKTEILPNGRKIITLSRPNVEETSMQVKELYRWVFKLRGSSLPSFVLRDEQHKTIKSSELKGKVVIVNFWFTHCKPCIEEMPELNQLEKENVDKNVMFLGITFESSESVQKFLSKFPFNFRIVPDAKSLTDKINVITYPATLIIDKTGIVRDVFVGADVDLKKRIQVAIDLLNNNAVIDKRN